MTSDETLGGTRALVTGASSGIGTATARALAREGATVAVTARREQRLESLAADLREEFGVEALAVPADVRDPDAVESLVAEVVDATGGLDLLVNNVGTVRGSDVEEMTTDEYRTMMEVNADGYFFATREALPHLREAEGTAVFVGSFAGQFPRPFNPVYAATKWWVRGFAKSLSASVGDEVAVTVVNPSEVRTEFAGEIGTPFEERFEPGEVTEPEEVAEAIVFAAEQGPSMVSELDVYRRDKLTFF